jgi:hypothetical protein
MWKWLRRLPIAVGRQRQLVGADAHGNKYYELALANRLARVIETPNGEVEEAFDPNSVPIEWQGGETLLGGGSGCVQTPHTGVPLVLCLAGRLGPRWRPLRVKLGSRRSALNRPPRPRLPNASPSRHAR